MPNKKRQQQNREAQRRYREKKKRENQQRADLELTPEANEVNTNYLTSSMQEPACLTTATQNTVDNSQGRLRCSLIVFYRQKCRWWLLDAFIGEQSRSSTSTISREYQDAWRQPTNVDLAASWPPPLEPDTFPMSTLQTSQPQNSVYMMLVKSAFQSHKQVMQRKYKLAVKRYQIQSGLRLDQLEKLRLERTLAELGWEALIRVTRF